MGVCWQCKGIYAGSDGVGHKQYIYVMDEQGGPIEQVTKPMH